jgi:glycosyltransferase involved in cell wall biosynthesis
VLFPSSARRPEKRFSLAEEAVGIVRRSGVDVELHSLEDIPHDDVPTWLNASDAILLTSTHEGSPNVVKEALACDVAVVSVDVGDARTRISDVDGCHIADPEPNELAAKLIATLERGLPIAGRRHVVDLALPRIAARLRDVYETLVRTGR